MIRKLAKAKRCLVDQPQVSSTAQKKIVLHFKASTKVGNGCIQKITRPLAISNYILSNKKSNLLRPHECFFYFTCVTIISLQF
jgi:hypothetical protein